MATLFSELPKRAFRPLPLGTVKPAGWLRDQLRIQADGLSGHLDEFWPELGPDSGWLGGNGESWEIGPYWLDGLVPLAWHLDDIPLQTKARTWIDWTLTHLGADGWIGPPTDHADKWWPRAVMCKVLAQYAEATGDARVEPAMRAYFTLLADRLPEEPLFMWGKFRWCEYLPSLIWLAERHDLPAFGRVAELINAQGYDWTDHFTYFVMEKKIRANPNLATHVVNHAMGIKYPALWSLFSGRDIDAAGSDAAIAVLDRFHGCATGLFTGDEHLSGLNPSQGTELCAVVEYMYSLETLAAWFGNVAYIDRLESLAFNNLPGTFSADMWAHQYDQQANQVQCTVAKRDWTNGEDANIYGLAPNYKCCTGNFSQGWPKYVSNLWYGTHDNGVAAAAFGPSVLETTLGRLRVRITEETDYPFSGTVTWRIESPGTARFPFYVRIPSWAQGAQIAVNEESPAAAEAGTFHYITRAWANGDRVTLSLPMKLRVSERFKGSASIHRGPLTFSLLIGARWNQVAGERPHADYEVYPTAPWNYALELDREKPESSLRVEERPIVMPCFTELNAPVRITAKGRSVPEWGMEGASAAPPPKSPVTTTEPAEDITLIPYGAAKLRITEFPVAGQ